MEGSGIDSIMMECQNLMSTLLNESSSISANESDYTHQNSETEDPSENHSQQENASISDTKSNDSTSDQGSTPGHDDKSRSKYTYDIQDADIAGGDKKTKEDSLLRHLPPESARVSKMYKITDKVTSVQYTLDRYMHRIKNIDDKNEGLPNAGIYVIKIVGENPYTYTGQFRDSLPHGRGMAVWENGYYYEGYFLKGRPNHHGRSIDPSGNLYVGYRLDGNKHGYGTMTYSSGYKYSGRWRHNIAQDKDRLTMTMRGMASVYQDIVPILIILLILMCC